MNASGSESGLLLRPRRRTVPATSIVPVFAAVVAIILAFVAIDTVLVRVSHQQRLETGRSLYARAQELQQHGDHAEALELFRSAYNHNPDNVEYHMGFIRALRATGREPDARAALHRLLTRSPANGPANIELGRSLAKAGEWREAAWYFRRGMYGEWPGGRGDNTPLHFELADLFAANNARQELLSELLLLDTPAMRDYDLRRLAGLLLSAQSWTRAEEVYRLLRRAAPSDPELWTGLGRAQFGRRRFAAAERSFERAADLRPGDTGVQEQLALTREVIGLDPTQRRLPPAEKHRRAHHLVAAVLAAVEHCAPQDVALRAPRIALESHSRGRPGLAAAEADLDLLDELWSLGESACKSGLKVPQPVRLIVSQLQGPAA